MSDIHFNKKFKPLFNLLNCREKLVKLKSIENPTDEDLKQIAYNEGLKKVDTVLLSGGRDSGKSFSLGCFNIVASNNYAHRILFTRQTMSSSDLSITENTIKRLRLLGKESDYTYANNTFSCKNNIGQISITGQKTSVGTQTAKLKSIEDFTVFITDEGQEMPSFDEWLTVKRSIRGQDLQNFNIISFNPPTVDHWLFSEFYEDVPSGFNGIIGKTMYIHTTYLDNGQANMTEANWSEYEELRLDYELYSATDKTQREFLSKKIIKNHSRYKHEILGGFKLKAEGVIYEDWEYGDFDESLSYVNTLDFGSNDPNASCKVAIDESKKRIYVKENFLINNIGTDQLLELIKSTIGLNDFIVGDSAGKITIRDLYEKGVNIEKCRKKNVPFRIKTIKNYTIVVAPNSPNVTKALNGYKWAVSKADVPHHDFSDMMDAMGYGVMHILQGNNSLLY
jgi:phage terminase large subunit